MRGALSRPGLMLLAAALLGAVVSLTHCDPFPGGDPARDGGPGAASDATASDAADSGLPDGPEPGLPDGACVEPKAASLPCFLSPNPACAVESVSVVQTIPQDGGTSVFAYPHGIAVSRGVAYFALQRDTNPTGRNRADIGFMYRWDGSKLERLTDVQEAPAFVVATRDHVYWRAREAGNPNRWLVRRLAISGSASCDAGCTMVETVGVSDGNEISNIQPESATAVLFRSQNFLQRAVFNNGWSTSAINQATTPAALGRGPRVFWASQSNVLEVVGGGVSQLYTRRGDAAPDPEGYFLYGGCSGAFAYDPDFSLDGAAPALFQVTQSGFAPIACSNCNPARTFDFNADEAFFFVARSDGQGLQAIPRAGGANPQLLVSGDIWDVASDNEYVYFTDINGKRVGRIKKR